MATTKPNSVPCRKSRLPPGRKIAPGTAITVTALICEAIIEADTAHHGRLCSPRKKPSSPLTLPLSRCHRRYSNRFGTTFILASSKEDIGEVLRPEVRIEKGFGREVRVVCQSRAGDRA